MAADPNMPWGWVPPEWNDPGFHAPPVAPADEWNDGGGPAANAEIAAANLAAMRAQAQAAADKTLGTAGGLSFGEGMTQEQLDALNGPSPERDLKQLNRQRGIVSDAARNALGTGGGYAFDEGMSKELMNAVAGEPPRGPMLASAPRGRAYIAQSTGPIGTIGTMGHDPTVAAAGMPLGDMSHLNADLAAATPPGIEMDDEYVGKPIEFDDEFVGRHNVNTSDPMPPEETADGSTSIEMPEEPGRLPDDELTPEQLGIRYSDTLSDDEKLEKLLANEQARENYRNAETVKASTRALKEQQDAATAYEQSVRESREATAQNSRDAQKLAQETIDPLRDISTGQKIAGVLAAFIGGFAANKTGRNMGLETVNSMIDDAIRVQTANLNNRKDVLGMKRNAIADQMALGKDLYHAQETVRLAAYDAAIRKVETDAANLDPRGTRALKAMRIRDQLIGQRDALAAKGAEADQKRREAIIKAQLDAARVDEDIRKNKASEANDRRRIGLGYAEMKQRGDIEQKKIDLEGKKLTAEEKAKSDKASLEQGIAAPPVLSFDASGAPIVNRNTGNLKQADGSDWIIPTTPEAQEFRKKKAAADSIIQILDEIRSIRDRVGGESSWGNSPERQRLDVLQQNLVALKKGGMQGMSSDADMARLEKMLGADSPASFRSQAAKLDTGRDQVARQINTEARNLKYTGKDIEYPDPLKHRAQSTTEEKTTGSVLAGQGEGYEGGATLRQRRLGELFSQATESTDPKVRQSALRELEQGVASGDTDEVRNAYRGALTLAQTRLATNPTISPAEREAIQRQLKGASGSTDADRLKFK